ncbi:MAG: phage holin family protein [Ferruginibacter sp.]
MKFLLRILISTVNAFVLAYILPGIELKTIFTAIILALLLAVLDAVVKPILVILTLPATLLTLGLFLFVINACIILTAEYFIDGFKVAGFWHAMLFSILLSFFNSFVHKRAFPKEEKASS